MSAQGIRAGRAYVELGTNDSRLVAGLRAAQQKLRAFGLGVAAGGAALIGAGTAILTPMIAASAQFASSGDELSKMADKTGASVESLSELRHAAKQSAVDFRALGTALNKQQRSLAEAAQGNQTIGETYDRLGLSVDALMQMSPDEQFEAIAQRISEIEDPAKRTAAAMDIFGKSGADLLPLMIGGAQGIHALRAEARALGLQVSAKDAAAATLLGDTWANVHSVLGAVTFKIGSALAPALTDVMNLVIPFIVGIARWIDNNRQLVVTVAAVAAGVVAAGVALVGVGGTLLATSAAIGGVMAVGSALTGVLSAIVSPAGLLIGVAVGLVAAFLQWTAAGQAVVGWFAGEFGKLAGIVTDTVGGMFNAIRAGRLELAAEIAFTGVKLAIATVMESVLSLFGLSIEEMMNGLARLLQQIQTVANELNIVRLNASDWLAKGMGFLIGQEVETGDNAGLAAALDRRSTLAQQDPAAIGRIWANALDPAVLRAKLAELNDAAAAAAQDSATLDIAALNFDASAIDIEGIGESVGQTARGLKTSGTFSAAEAAMFGGPGDDIDKQQLEELREIRRHSRRTAEKRGGVAT